MTAQENRRADGPEDDWLQLQMEAKSVLAKARAANARILELTYSASNAAVLSQLHPESVELRQALARALTALRSALEERS